MKCVFKDQDSQMSGFKLNIFFHSLEGVDRFSKFRFFAFYWESTNTK